MKPSGAPPMSQRELILQAEAELAAKRADYDAQLLKREQLQRQIILLESVAQQDSMAEVLHHAVLRAMSSQPSSQPSQPEVAAVAAPATAQEATSAAPLRLEDLPLALAAFDDTLLQRIADMTLEDCIVMYKAFIQDTQHAVMHVKFHGADSYLRPQMEAGVARFGNMVLAMGFVLLPLMRRILPLNYVTLQDDEAPTGWYTRVAQLIPVHADFASLVQGGIACVQDSLSREFESSGEVLHQLRRVVGDEEQMVGMLSLDSLLERFDRCANWVTVLRTLLGVYLLGGMMRTFDPVVYGEMFVSCWPYSCRPMLIFEEYWKRPEVQAAAQQRKAAQGQ